MARKAQAALCRKGLESTLRSVHEFTAGATTAAGLLLHRMNAVLSSVVGTDFGSGNYDSIDELYDLIDRERLDIVDRCEDIPIFLFARSFATVIEEAVRKLQQAKTVTVPPSPNNTVSEVSSGETPREEQSVEKKDEEDRKLEAPAVAAPAAASGLKPLEIQPLMSADRGRKEDDRKTAAPKVAKPAAPAAVKIPQPAAAPTADMKGLVGTEEWRNELQQRFSKKILDFSYEAIEGRITIGNILWSVREEEIRELLRPFGRILYFYYNNRSGLAVAKLQSNRAADEAVARLHGTLFRGRSFKAMRAMYDARSLPRQLQQQQQSISCSKGDSITVRPTSNDEKAFAAAFAATTKAAAATTGGCRSKKAAEAAVVDCVNEEKQDSDDDLSFCGSNFSVD